MDDLGQIPVPWILMRHNVRHGLCILPDWLVLNPLHILLDGPIEALKIWKSSDLLLSSTALLFRLLIFSKARSVDHRIYLAIRIDRQLCINFNVLRVNHLILHLLKSEFGLEVSVLRTSCSFCSHFQIRSKDFLFKLKLVYIILLIPCF